MKLTFKYLLLFSLGFISCSTPQEEEKITKQVQVKTPTTATPDFQNGDIIFHTSTSNQSLAIQLATKSKYSHVGMIVKDEKGLFVFEAVQPVKLTPLAQFIKRGKDGHYVVKRLKNSKEVITPKSIFKMKAIGKRYLGKQYDLKFEWSDDKLYCSELVWKIYKEVYNIELGQLEQLKDFDLSDKAVQAKVKERYGNQLPLEEYVITPDRIFRSDQLITVISK